MLKIFVILQIYKWKTGGAINLYNTYTKPKDLCPLGLVRASLDAGARASGRLVSTPPLIPRPAVRAFFIRKELERQDCSVGTVVLGPIFLKLKTTATILPSAGLVA